MDDGSSDGSTETIRRFARQDRHVRPVIFARNFGHQIAITAGWDYARGDAVVTIDGDLQDPPEAIPELVRKWREGYEVVYAVRSEREGEGWFKKLHGRPLLSTDLPHHRRQNTRGCRRFPVDGSQGSRCSEADAGASSLPAWHVCLGGFSQVGVAYKRSARYAGVTKYPFRRMLLLALNAITSFSYFPLQVATFFGFFSAGLAILAIPVVVYLRMAGIPQFTGQATTLIAVLFLGGIQLISLGVLGEYIGRLYDEAKRQAPLHRPRRPVGLTSAARRLRPLQVKVAVPATDCQSTAAQVFGWPEFVTKGAEIAHLLRVA